MTAGCARYGVDAAPQAIAPATPRTGRGLPLVGHTPWFYADTNGFLLRLARSQGDVGRLQPAFCRQQLTKYGEAVPPFAARLADRWTHGDPLNVSAAMDELAMAVVVQTLLGKDIEREAAPLAADLRVLARWLPVLVAPLARQLERAGLPPWPHSAAHAPASPD